MAMLSINGRVGLCALQRLSSLLPSGAPTEEKMQAAAVLCESLTETLVADVKKKEHRNKVNLNRIVEQLTDRTASVMFNRHRTKAKSTEDDQRRTRSCQAGDESHCERDFICWRGAVSNFSCKASPTSSLRPGSEADHNDRRPALALHQRSQQRRQPLGLPDPGE